MGIASCTFVVQNAFIVNPYPAPPHAERCKHLHQIHITYNSLYTFNAMTKIQHTNRIPSGYNFLEIFSSSIYVQLTIIPITWRCTCCRCYAFSSKSITCMVKKLSITRSSPIHHIINIVCTFILMRLRIHTSTRSSLIKCKTVSVCISVLPRVNQFYRIMQNICWSIVQLGVLSIQASNANMNEWPK